MQTKHNTNLTSVAKMLRKNMTKEEKKLWYDFLRYYPVRFYRQKVLRISNLQIIRDFAGACTYIDHAVQQALSQ